MENTEMKKIIDRQRAFFHTGTTLDVSFRIAALKRLQHMIRRHEKEIEAALLLDLKKSSFESYMCETGLVRDEIHYMLRHIRSFAKEQDVRTPLAQFCSRSYRKPSPYGVTLIISPWNYPILLTLDPLIDAIAAGNTVILKPSAYSPACSDLLAKLIHRYFPAKYLTVITGGRSENTALLEQHFDYIFFTGSKTVGREVMRQASSHLTPVTLELGGKSPCLVDESADLALAARRIVFGKFLNCGQTCVAPDYIYCDEKRKEALICELKRQITKQFGSEPLKNPSYGKIINQKHFERIRRLLNPEKVIFGGNVNPDTLQIAPTLLDHVTFEDAIMQEEIFGPLLPVLTYSSLDEAIRTEEKVCHYLDVPIQHASDRILKRMGRRTNQAQLREIIGKLRAAVPDIALRTTMIAGFPGETQEDHEEVMRFVDEMEFERLGVFTYSAEEDTPAATFPDQIPEEVKEERRDEIMELQQEIAFEKSESMVGRVLDVMIEGKVADEAAYVGRTYMDAPNVDGYIFVNSGELFMSGDFVRVKVIGSNDYDLIGEVYDESAE